MTVTETFIFVGFDGTICKLIGEMILILKFILKLFQITVQASC